jgi:membrane protease YdiL (CAAX protease family)
MDPHHQALLVGYAVALLGWLGTARACPKLWPHPNSPSFAHPWRELGYALLACAAVLAIGQGYVHGYRLSLQGPFAPLVDALDQVLIFLPLFLLLIIRRQGPETAWLPTNRVWQRLLIGTGLALLAILAFTLTRAGSDNWLKVVPRVYRLANISWAVQIFCEDVAIAILFVRFQAALGVRLSILLVALLFASAHLPTLLAQGASYREVLSLLPDAGLGVLVLIVVRRSQDIWWFWCVHFAMDLMQFYALPAAPPGAG